MRRSVSALVLGALLLGVLLLSAGSLNAQEGQPIWDTFLYTNEVRSLAYDGQRLWLATGGGAVAYDPITGAVETHHRKRDGLLSDSLSGVAVDGMGSVWFGTEKVGISVLDPQTDTWEPFTSLLRPIPGDNIQRIRIAGDSLFVGTDRGFALFVGGDQKVVCLEGVDLCELSSFNVHDLASDPEGDGLWIATAEGVVHRDALGGFTSYTLDVGTSVATRMIRHRGAWVVVFPDGIHRLDPVTEEWLPLGGPSGEGSVVDLLSEGETLLASGNSGVWSRQGDGGWSIVGDRSLPATSLLRTTDGTLWVGCRDSNEQLDGLWYLDGNQWQRIVFPGPSVRSHYRAMAFDGDGTLHLLHAAPATAAMRQSFDGVTWSNPKSVGDWSFDILFGPDGALWLAQCCCGETGCQLRKVVDETMFDQPPRNLRDIVFDADGNLWCASDHAPDNEEFAEGLWFMHSATGDWTQITVETPGAEMLRNRVRAVLPRGRDLWIGYSDRGVHHWDLGPDRIPLTSDDGDWTLYSTEGTTNRRLISDSVTRLAALGSRVWVGTTAGLSLIDPADITNIGAGFFGLPSPIVNDILLLKNGGAYVATQSAGLTRMTPADGRFEFETWLPPDLPHPNVETLALDPDGRAVWAGTNRGLGRVVLADSGAPGGDPLIAYPNPFVPGCGEGIRMLGFTGIGDGVVADVSGRIVGRFDQRAPGDVVWDGRSESGEALAPGLYWIRLSSPEGIRAVGVGLGDGPCPQ